MPGAESLGGLVYQQRYTYFCVLSQVSLAATGTADTTARVVKFSIEGRACGDGPVWDIVFEYSDESLELHECKDTAITMEDRLTIYDRLRRQVAAGTPADKIRPAWVTDPDKQTPNALAYLEGMAAGAESVDLSHLPPASPARVDSVADAIQEAVYRLCHYAGEADNEPTTEKQRDAQANRMAEWPRPCTIDEAMAVLKNLRVVRQRFSDLDHSIRLLSTGAFTSGTPDSLQAFVTGVLTDRVVSEGTADFSVDEFLEAIGTVTLEHGLKGLLRDLMAYHSANGLRPKVRRIEWRNLPGNPITEWALIERIPTYDTHRSACLLAEMGGGKTVTSQLSFGQQAEQGHPSRTLRLEARSLDSQHLDALVRLCCMLCGIGPTWLAIDGLDEVPHGMREHWIRALETLISLPNLTILVTIRREVFTVHEWLADAVSFLPKIDLQPLSTQQVEQAFADVGLPVLSNAQLLAVLRNPFLLSLYADIVAPTDMPLAQSGEVTAFRVIGEFWQRRARGASTGHRAVGDSELSQEPKRKALVYLGEQTMAGGLVISRDGLDPEVEKGIEMLLREGVLREQGPRAVAWAHDWLREYSLIETLRSGIETVTATSLAATIASVCTTDHVARAAAAAGVKWVSSMPAVGSPHEYVVELACHKPGLARDALIVLLEAEPTPDLLAQLQDELLAEALTLAVGLRVPHWKEQVAAIDEGRFFGPRGERLHKIAVDYELCIAPGAGHPARDVVRRVTARDLRRWKANTPSSIGTAATLLEAIVATAAYGDQQVDEWLLLVGSHSSVHYLGHIRDAITGLIAANAIELANNLYRATMGFNEAKRGAAIANSLIDREFVYGSEFVDLLHSPGILCNVDTWGRTAIELLTKLIEAKQQHRWPRTSETDFTPDYDEDARASTLDHSDEDHPICRMRNAIENVLRVLVAESDGHSFQTLTDIAIETRHAAVLTLPLLALYDASANPSKRLVWHESAIVGLLTNPHVFSLTSLHDVRRLLRRQLPTDLSADTKARVASAIRDAPVKSVFQVRELADLRHWAVLTDDELANIDNAEAEGDLREPVDPRSEPLFRIDRRPISAQLRRDSGWPYPEDEEHIRTLQTSHASNSSDAPSPDEPVVARQIQALNVVLARPEAKTERWSGTVLSWCQSVLSALRRHAELQAKPDTLTPEAWEEILNYHAPWWRDMALLALTTLQTTVPQRHNDKPLERNLSFNSDDPVFAASRFLDNALAIDAAMPFADLQTQLIATVTQRWKSWPLFTKGTVLSTLRTWFTWKYPDLRAILTDVVKTEPNQYLVHHATRLLLGIARVVPVPELADFLERAKAGSQNEPLGEVARFLGESYLYETVRTSGTGLAAASLLDGGLRSKWPDPKAQMLFLRGVIWGASDVFCQFTPDEREHAYDRWLQLIEQIIAIWPFDLEDTGDSERFPVLGISQVLENEPLVEIRSRLLLRLVPTFQAILRLGELAAVCQLHFDLKQLIGGGRALNHGSLDRMQGVIMSEAMETALAELCRAATGRVLAWHLQGARTNDMGWVSTLRGKDTVEFIKECIGVSRNRAQLKRELLPCADILADAGQPDLAAALRVFLRNS